MRAPGVALTSQWVSSILHQAVEGLSTTKPLARLTGDSHGGHPRSAVDHRSGRTRAGSPPCILRPRDIRARDGADLRTRVALRRTREPGAAAGRLRDAGSRPAARDLY